MCPANPPAQSNSKALIAFFIVFGMLISAIVAIAAPAIVPSLSTATLNPAADSQSNLPKPIASSLNSMSTRALMQPSIATNNVAPLAGFIVNDAGDAADAVPDGNCVTAGAVCTLRAAIQESNNSGVDDNITFDPSLNGSTITLDSALDAISDSVVISGPGADLLTVERNDAAATKFRIFTINSGQTVSLSGLTLTKGHTADGTDGSTSGNPGANGGAILNSGTLTLTDVVIIGNRTGNGGNATTPGITFGGPGGYGGGISSTGSLTMSNVTVSNNVTGDGGDGGFGHHGGLGGGIQVTGALTMTACAVTDNNTGIGGVGSQSGASGGPGGSGGGIHAETGTFDMTNITVTGNTTGDGAGESGNGGFGGGIFLSGTSSLVDSTVSGNTTGDASAGVAGQAGFGGGIFNGSTLTLTGSAITGNATGFNGPGGGGFGGGIDNSGTLAMSNITISGNSTVADGGTGAGLWNAGPATLTNCTIVFNSSAATFGGAGIHHFNLSSVVNIGNTIVAGNSLSGSPNGPDVETSIAYNSQGNNLIGNGEGSSGFTQPGDQVGTSASPINPRLAPLANNGGLTQTHALLAGSPALDGGNNTIATNSGLTTDQRGDGFVRIADGPDADATTTVDIGAFEAQVWVEDISDRSINEDAGDSFSFDVGGEAAITTVTATSSNTTLVPNNPANLEVTGAGSSRTLTVNTVANLSGTTTITVTINSVSGSMTDTFVLTVNAANDPPTANPQSTVTNEDTPVAILLSGTDVETPSPELIFAITQQPTNGVLSGTGNNRTYTPDPNFNGADSFQFTVTDTGDGSSPPITSAAAAVDITVSAVNDAPVNTVPAHLSATENSFVIFSIAGDNQITISDVDAGSNPVQVMLSATNGTITLASTAGLIFTAGDGTNDAAMTFSGSLANIFTALIGMTFRPTAGFAGPASLQVVTNDQGNTGSGGARTDSDTVLINVLEGGALAFSSSFTVGESGPQATITVTRSGGASSEARVDFATSDGTATGGGTDYTTATGTLIFPHNVTSQTFNVLINDDNIDESNETVNLTLSNPQGSGALGTPSTALLTIADNDEAPSISIDTPSVTEGDSGTVDLVFTVTLSIPSSQTITVNYATENNTATAPSDFVAIPTTQLTFNPLETSKQITVLVNGDTDFELNEALVINLSSPSNATLATNQGVGFITDDDAPGGKIAFSSSSFTVNEDAGSAIITVNRSGATTQAVTVDYLTLDVTARERSDYTTTLGTLDFAAGATSATFSVPVNVDSFVEGSEFVQLILTNPSSGVALGAPETAVLQIDDVATALPNTIDDPGHFVDQHYHDFLNRVPDPLGRAFWIGEITGCGSDATCIEIKRINVSAAFFLSIEFQETGVTAFLTHNAAFGSALPVYRTFERDTQALQRNFVFGTLGADAILEANKVAFFNSFVNRLEFAAIFGSLTNEQYIDALIANTGVTFTAAERDALVNGLNGATETRATVLRKIAENTSFRQAQFNRTFVYMQYIGYLRRNPADPPDNNLDGFNFWLTKLNQFNGNFIEAEMVKAFISSIEYRQRFGQ